MAFLTRFISVAGLLLALCGAATPAMANNLQLTEQKIKAGLLYNFIKHTTWPAEAVPDVDSRPLTVCVYGKDIFEDYLRPMEGRTVKQRKILVKHIESTDESASCEILFIGSAAQQDWPPLREFLEQRQVLTVSDFPGFAHKGGMIEFQQKEMRIGAIFNLDAFRNADLQIGEPLLTLAGVETLSSTGVP